jgi:8-oxo-dGTP pyrophosphatase MutT (NUDIX family)
MPPEPDPVARLLERVIGVPSPQLLADIAAPRRDAAVLVGLLDRGPGPAVLLTERAAHLAQHPGQISFPGGGLRSGGEDVVAAALREAGEEVGLAASQVEVAGCMPAQLTVTGFRVTPVVGWLDAGFTPRADPAEVAATFEVPLAHLLAPGCRRREIRERHGSRFYTDVFIFERYRIWGATAAILDRFLEAIDEKTSG